MNAYGFGRRRPSVNQVPFPEIFLERLKTTMENLVRVAGVAVKI
jgi:hypothetical protein